MDLLFLFYNWHLDDMSCNIFVSFTICLFSFTMAFFSCLWYFSGLSFICPYIICNLLIQSLTFWFLCCIFGSLAPPYTALFYSELLYRYYPMSSCLIILSWLLFCWSSSSNIFLTIPLSFSPVFSMFLNGLCLLLSVLHGISRTVLISLLSLSIS